MVGYDARGAESRSSPHAQAQHPGDDQEQEERADLRRMETVDEKTREADLVAGYGGVAGGTVVGVDPIRPDSGEHDLAVAGVEQVDDRGDGKDEEGKG